LQNYGLTKTNPNLIMLRSRNMQFRTLIWYYQYLSVWMQNHRKKTAKLAKYSV